MAIQHAPLPALIPIIDLAGTRHDAHRRQAAAAAIGAAARDSGFFYVVNHGVPDVVVNGAFDAARRFFALPAEQKMALLMQRGHHLGYEPLEYQQLEATRPSDRKESFGIASDAAGNEGVSTWPADLPGYREAVLAYHAAAVGLGAHLMSLIATSLDLPDDTFVGPYADASITLRTLRYPPDLGDALPDQIGAGAHTDWGGITVLAQDASGGLEIREPFGTWLRAAPVPGAFVINLGDMMVRWTNEHYRSTLHRVRSEARDHDRYSMALFYSPRSSARIECLPTCLAAGETPRYAVCTAGEHNAQRRRETYGLL
jgi:isopenicillin N synthase-like dioxygenase